MTRRAFLGLDCGTQSTKALLVDAERCDVLAVGRADHPLTERPDGTREQDPMVWVTAATNAIRDARAAAGMPIDVAAIGVSGQQHGLVCLDEAGRPVRPAKLWNDTTAAAQGAALEERVGGRDAVLALTGNRFLPGYTAPKLLWLREREADSYDRTAHVCLPHDFLDLWLSGRFATEPGDASGTAYLDVRQRRWSEPVLAAIDAGRDWQRTLPEIVPSRSVIGTVRDEAAAATGLAAGTPVSGGGGDNMCAAIGIGVTVPGVLGVSLGTSGTAFAHADEPAVDPRGEAAAFCDSAGGWLPLACTLNCAGATDWVRALVGLPAGGFDAALERSGAGARGLTFLPYLDGERTPDLPHGSGMFHGLRTDHGAADLVRAVTEGVTIGLRYGLEALARTGVSASEAILVGGGARSDAWAQLLADVLEVPVQRPREVEAAALGAALQARWVVDGAPPPAASEAAAGADRFDPRRSAALGDAIGRHAELRALAVSGAL